MSKKTAKKTTAEYSYYWIEPGGTYRSSRGGSDWINCPIADATRVWRQGPKGGVKIIHDSEFARYEYITQQPQAMAEFERAKTFALLSS